MPSLTFPLSRIEGHAQAVIEVQAGKVVSARFEAMEFRGFDYLVRNMPAEQIVVVAPRICGVCSTAHHVAAVKALEQIYGVSPPPLALKVRELLMLGQIIQNQATSLFIFTMPDRLGLSSIFQWGGESGAEHVNSAIASRALRVRKAGTDLIRAAGGQFIHPVNARVGGVSSGIDIELANSLRTELAEVLPVACELFDLYWDRSLAMGERLNTWGDDGPAYYISAVADQCPNFYGDAIRVMCPEGTVLDSFPADEFRRHLAYEQTDYSYADRTSFEGQVMRANSLARINMNRSMGTPRADQYLDQFRETFGRPAHAIMLFDLARGIELVYSLERAIEMLDEPLTGQEVAVSYVPCDGEGYGLVEAPRGPLIHHYTVEDGRIAQAEFIIPTVHNVMAIERALTVAAERYITPQRVDMELESAVGRVVRAFDPCIACATH